MAKLRQGFQEEPLPSKLNVRVWKKIFSYALRHPFLILGSLICMLFTTFYDSSFIPVMNAAAIKAAEKESFFQATSIWEAEIDATFIFGIQVHFTFQTFFILMMVMILLRSLSIFLNFMMTNFVSMKIMLDLRKDTFEKIQRLSFSYFDKNSSGWLIARMQGDTAALGDVIAWSFSGLLWSAFELIFAIITMFSVNIKFSFIGLALTPIIIIAAPLLQRYMLKAHRTERAAQSYYVSHLSESIDGAKTVKTLAIENTQKEQTELIAGDIAVKRQKAIRSNAYLPPLLTIISGCSTAILIAVGNQAIIDGETAIDAAMLVLFISLVSSIFEPLQGITEVLADFFASQAGAEKVVQLLEAPIEIEDSKEALEKYGDLFHPKKEAFPHFEGRIEFKDVSFGYNENKEILHHINLTIEKGTSIALVGETGSGKTTLANLICRFYPLTQGNIEIDGVSINEVSLSALRHNIGYVQQTPFLFDKTFYENIAFGSEDATIEKVQQAAHEVGIDEFIRSFENGYDHKLEDGGNGISQGQKQLICLARALVRNPAILILDEATSSIDAVTELQVQRAISKLCKGRTSLIIAHRLSTIIDCDRILVLDQGSIKEDGSHNELLKMRGAYYRLYQSQFDQMTLDQQMELNEKMTKKFVK